MSYKLGILGGMGPLATVTLFERIVLLTDAKCDQNHLHIFIDNYASIPDRTSYLIGKGENPKEYLIESAKRLQNIGADFLIMPCNTAHYFYKDIIKEINIPFLNMIEETAKFTLDKYPQMNKIGLLATDGTCNTKIYDDYFSKYNIEVVKPSKEKQTNVMELIYNMKIGIKDICLEGFYETIEEMKGNDVEVFILGCTELSSAYQLYAMKGTYIDPIDVIAQSAIKYAGKNVRQNKLEVEK